MTEAPLSSGPGSPLNTATEEMGGRWVEETELAELSPPILTEPLSVSMRRGYPSAT